MKTKRKFIPALAAGLLLTVTGSLPAVEEAEYTVVRKDDDIELRDYEPSIVAETVVEGDMDAVGNKAFRKLFNYISGDNTAQEKIAMTAPVSQENRSEKIAMTAPVGQRPEKGGWAVSFMMPASYTMETIPRPADPDVVIRQVPAYRAAVIRYSGRWTEKSYLKNLALLQEWIRDNQLEVMGDPIWAKYDAPFKPWFMRRNEILIPVS